MSTNRAPRAPKNRFATYTAVVALVLLVGMAGILVMGPLVAGSATTPTSAPSASIAAAAKRSTTTLPSRRSWLSQTSRALSGAQRYLTAHAGSASKPAIVLDIDNTSLQTHYAWPKPVPATLATARFAAAHGYAVFFVTGRYTDDAAAVKPILTQAGYPVTAVLGRTRGQGLAASKQHNRDAITSAGFTIVMDIGNHATDLAGTNTGKRIKLPSYNGLLS